MKFASLCLILIISYNFAVCQTPFTMREVQWQIIPPDDLTFADSIITQGEQKNGEPRKRKFITFRQNKNSLVLSFTEGIKNDSLQFQSLVNKEIENGYKIVAARNQGLKLDSLRSQINIGSASFIKIEFVGKKDAVAQSVHIEYKSYYRGYRLFAVIDTQDEETAKKITHAVEHSQFL